MKLTRKKSCLIIYALFFAIFKPYFLPTNMQQGIKILIIMWCLFLIAIKMKPIRWINISLLYSGIIAISSYIAYKNNYVSQSTLLDGRSTFGNVKVTVVPPQELFFSSTVIDRSVAIF